jgi:GxxExxY protein
MPEDNDLTEKYFRQRSDHLADVTRFPDLGALLTQRIIGSAINVHKEMGPGLLESVYEECLAIQFDNDSLLFERQKTLPIVYAGKKLDTAYKVDFLIEKKVIIELKAVEKILPIHEAQILTYMRLARI